MSVTLAGTYSGLNVSAIITTIINADSIPITNLQTTNTNLEQKSATLGTLGTSLGTLSQTLQSLNSPTLFGSKVATASTTSVGTAAATSTASSGTVAINITQLATTTSLRGGIAGGAYADGKLAAPPAGGTAIGTVLNEASVDGQTFSINGKQIKLAASDLLDDGNPNSAASVIGKINNSGAGVTASYDASTGAVSLSSGSPIVLGSASDTSDFLQKSQLFTNGTGSISSTVGLGRIDPAVDLATAGLHVVPTAGTFTVNGVSINYTSGQTLQDVINSINTSSAGVTAIYDNYEDQIVLSSSQRGPQAITVADGTGNLASALRLTSGDSQTDLGKATLFTVNGSSTVRQSNSNVLTGDQLGVQGLTFTATGTGATQVTVAPDVTTVANAINAFIAQYNSTQGLVTNDTSVNPSDTTKNGPLATDTNLTFLGSQLRQVTAGSTSNSAVIRMLSDLGVTSNANDNTLSQVDSTKLQDALTNHLSDVQALFNDPIHGLTTTVQSVLSSYNDSLGGIIVNEQNAIKTQESFNKQQITRMQEEILVEQQTLQQEFAALDQIQSTSQAISGVFGSGTISSSSSGSSSGSKSIGTVGSSTG